INIIDMGLGQSAGDKIALSEDKHLQPLHRSASITGTQTSTNVSTIDNENTI
ncbi:unnamed protein product, partial [Didymodactylos carnosus]